MSQVTGIVKIYLDGALQRSKPGAKLKLGGYKRTPHTGHSHYGTSDEVVSSELDCTLVDMADTDAVELSNLRGVVVRFETDTGNTYQATMDTAEPCEHSGSEVTLKMVGEPAVLL